MRGKTSKRLRRLSERKHLELVASEKMRPPSSMEEAKWQLRKLTKLAKSQWRAYSNPKSLTSVDLSLSSRPRLRQRWGLSSLLSPSVTP